MTAQAKQIRALVGCIGKAGAGKSTKLRELADRCRRLIVGDVEGVWAPGKGDIVVEGWPALVEYLRSIDAEDRRVAFRVVYRERDPRRMADALGSLAFAVRDLTVVIDEIAWVSRPSYMPPPLERIIQFGRRYGINLLYTTREPQEVHNLLFSQATCLFFFRVEPGLGLDRIRRNYKALAAELPGLSESPPPLDFRIYGNPRSCELFGLEGLDSAPRRSRSSRRTT